MNRDLTYLSLLVALLAMIPTLIERSLRPALGVLYFGMLTNFPLSCLNEPNFYLLLALTNK